MDIEVFLGRVAQIEADAIVITLFEGNKSSVKHISDIDNILDNAIQRLIEKGEVKGKLNEITMIHSLGRLPAPHVVLLGLGKEPELSSEKVRGAMAEACRFL